MATYDEWVSVGADRWMQMEAEHNARWAQLAYLDGPGYTICDRLEAKMDLRRQYLSGSSSHGVLNSIEKIVTRPCLSLLTSSMVESNDQHNSRMLEYARQIQESRARIIELLQEEIDEQVADESVGVRTSMVKLVTPIVHTPLLNQDASCLYPITGAFHKGITHFDEPPSLTLPVVNWRSCKRSLIDISSMLITSLSLNSDILVLKPLHPCVFTLTPPPPKPPGRCFQQIPVKFQVTRNFTIHPPPPEPPEADHITSSFIVLLSFVAKAVCPPVVWENVCANDWVIVEPLPLMLSLSVSRVLHHRKKGI